MHRASSIFRGLSASALLYCLPALAQQPALAHGNGGSAEGRLSVTLTVVSSVELVVGPNGEQQIVVANAADPKDNVSRLQPVVNVSLTPVASEAAKTKPKKASRKTSTY